MKKLLVFGLVLAVALLGGGCSGKKSAAKDRPEEVEKPLPDLKESAETLKQFKTQ